MIQKSYETTPDDINVMKQIPNKKLLTTYGCSAIGTTEKRRINVAELTETKKEWSDLREHGSAPLSSPIPSPLTSSSPKDIQTIHNRRIFITKPTISSEKTTSAQINKKQINKKQIKTSKPVLYSSSQKITPKKTRSIKEIIIARNKKTKQHFVAEKKTSLDIPIIEKFKYHAKAVKLSTFIIVKLKFNTVFINTFILKVSERIETLQKQKNPSVQKIYILSLLKQELKKYMGN